MSVENPLEAKPARQKLQPLLRLLPYLRPYRSRVVMALVALLMASVATLVIPIAARRVVDHGFTAQNAALVNQYFAFMFLVVALLALGSSVRFYYVMWLGERVVADLRDALFSHLLDLTPSFFETQKTGDVVSRLTADTTQIKSAFSSTASIALRNAVMLAGALAMMIYTSPGMSGLAALAIPAVVLPLVFYGRRVRRLSRAAQDTLAASAAFAQERLSGISAVQSNTQEAATAAAFSACHHGSLRRGTGPHLCPRRSHLRHHRHRLWRDCGPALVWRTASAERRYDGRHAGAISDLCHSCGKFAGPAFGSLG